MAKLVYGLQQSLDGYVDHRKLGPPGPDVFRHFIELTRGAAGFLYGTNTYEIMRYWDGEESDWGETELEFAKVWRSKPKWVASKTLKTVGPNATLLTGEFVEAVKKLKAEQEGEILVAGPVLAGGLGEAGLIDEYRLYLRPVVVGEGAPFFVGKVPELKLVGHEVIGEEMVRVRYVPA